MPRTIVLAANTAWNLVNFRAGLIRELSARGYEIVAVAPLDPMADAVASLPCRFVPIEMDNMGTSPARDFRLIQRFYRLFRNERPALFLGFNPKPNIYGSIAAHAAGVPVINNITGHSAFIKETFVTKIMHLLYKFALRRSELVFFQNEDDRAGFVARKMVRAERAAILPGSGIDVVKFAPLPRPPERERRGFTFLLIARLLWDKGVREFVEAGRIVRRDHPDARLQLLGFLDVANRSAISREAVEAWVAAGDAEYLGSAADVRPHIAASDCVVLPSYREGTSRVLLEAAAMARPIIATDVPGCREVVDHEVSGLMCRARDAEDLAARMLQLMALDESRLRAMGEAGRAKVIREYDEGLAIASA